jgi:hypothetical protein
MANAYNGLYPAKDELTIGTIGSSGPAQVLFDWAGRKIQLTVPPGQSPIQTVNDYLDGLTKGPASIAGHGEYSFAGNIGEGEAQPSNDPDRLSETVNPTQDDSPTDMNLLSKASVNETPEDITPQLGNNPTYMAPWTPDGINTIKGYQPGAGVPVLTYKSIAPSIPLLQGFLQGVGRVGSDIAALPVLRLRRGLMTSRGPYGP